MWVNEFGQHPLSSAKIVDGPPNFAEMGGNSTTTKQKVRVVKKIFVEKKG